MVIVKDETFRKFCVTKNNTTGNNCAGHRKPKANLHIFELKTVSDKDGRAEHAGVALKKTCGKKGQE